MYRFLSTRSTRNRRSAPSRKKWPRCRARSTSANPKGSCATRCSIRPTRTSSRCATISSRRRRKLFDVGLYLTLYGDSKEEIDKVEGDIRGILDAKLVYTKPALFQQEQGFRSTLPLGPTSSRVNSKAEFIAALFHLSLCIVRPHERSRHPLRHQPPQLLAHPLRPLLARELQLRRLREVRLRQKLCVKLEILRSLMFGTDVIVIDPEREYEQLAEATGGRSFNISLSSEHHINPFDLPPVKEDEDPKDILRSTSSTSSASSASCSAASRRKKTRSSTAPSAKPTRSKTSPAMPTSPAPSRRCSPTSSRCSPAWRARVAWSSASPNTRAAPGPGS
jgi:hypothetical protein